MYVCTALHKNHCVKATTTINTGNDVELTIICHALIWK